MALQNLSNIEIDGKHCPVMSQRFPRCDKHNIEVVGVYAAGYSYQHCPKCHAEMKARKAKENEHLRLN